MEADLASADGMKKTANIAALAATMRGGRQTLFDGQCLLTPDGLVVQSGYV